MANELDAILQLLLTPIADRLDAATFTIAAKTRTKLMDAFAASDDVRHVFAVLLVGNVEYSLLLRRSHMYNRGYPPYELFVDTTDMEGGDLHMKVLKGEAFVGEEPARWLQDDDPYVSPWRGAFTVLVNTHR